MNVKVSRKGVLKYKAYKVTTPLTVEDYKACTIASEIVRANPDLESAIKAVHHNARDSKDPEFWATVEYLVKKTHKSRWSA